MGVTALAAPLAGDAATYRALAGQSRQALLAVLRQSGRPLDASGGGGARGLPPNTARVRPNVLCLAGLVRRRGGERGIPGRPRVPSQRADAVSGCAGAAAP